MTTQPIERPKKSIQKLKYLTVPNFLEKGKFFYIHYFFEENLPEIWFRLNDIYLISHRKNKINLARIIDADSHKTIKVVFPDDIHSVETFINLKGVLAILNRTKDDIRDFYTRCIIDLFITPCLSKPQTAVRKRLKYKYYI